MTMSKNDEKTKKCAFRVRYYADGKPRPLFRGVLHGVVTFLLITIALPGVVIALANGTLPIRWWKFVVFLAGKALSYGSSAILHLYPFVNLNALTNALKLDLLAINVSICVSCLCVWRIEYALGTGVVICLISAFLIYWQFRGHLGLSTPKGRSDTPRVTLFVAQWFKALLLVWWSYGFRDFVIGSYVFYIVAFLLSLPVTNAHGKEPMSKLVPWHKAGVYGFHEDFHWSLLLADLCSAGISIRILNAVDLI